MECSSDSNVDSSVQFLRMLAADSIRLALTAVCACGPNIGDDDAERVVDLIDNANVRIAASGLKQDQMIEIADVIGHGESLSPSLIISALGYLFEIEAAFSPDDAAVSFHSRFAAFIHRKGTEYKWT